MSNICFEEEQANPSKTHFIHRIGLRVGPNSENVVQLDHSVPSNMVPWLYTRVGPKYSLIPCDVLGSMILAPNPWIGFKKLGRAFPRPELSAWA